jgi:hypothetical protein
VDGIEGNPFHPEIEDDWLLVHQVTDRKRPSLTSFFRKRREGKESEQFIRFRLQPAFLELPCSRRGYAAQPLSWRAVLHLMWDTLCVPE